jgi:hypothetical protein
MSAADDLEKLAAEVLGNWSYGPMPSTGFGAPPLGPPTNFNTVPSAGSQSPQNTLPSYMGQKIKFEIHHSDQAIRDVTEELKRAQAGAAKPSTGSTQRVIPDRCSYARGQKIDGAPMIPMAPITEERHPDLHAAACAKIRRYVCTHYRAWPACPCSNRNVALTFQYGYDENLGDVLIGFLKCEECK